jgi:hypothetical protein
MELPNIVHPKKFRIHGNLFEVIAYTTLTDDQAAAAAMHFYRSHAAARRGRDQLFRVLLTVDQSSAGRL